MDETIRRLRWEARQMAQALTRRARPPPRGRRHRGQRQLEFPHVLDVADQTCPQCGGTRRPMVGRTEDAEETTVVERP